MRCVSIVLILVGALSNALPPAQAASVHSAEPGFAYRLILSREAEKVGLPVAVADAVVAIESGYDPAKIGGVGEIGLMQIRPKTAAMLGFVGSDADLARPDINIHYGVAYLAGAWRRAGGDLCRALMKYRAGHGEDVMSARSAVYCSRAKIHLAAVGSPFSDAVIGRIPMPQGASGLSDRGSCIAAVPRSSAGLRGAAFWAVHAKRVKAISACLARPRLMVSR